MYIINALHTFKTFPSAFSLGRDIICLASSAIQDLWLSLWMGAASCVVGSGFSSSQYHNILLLTHACMGMISFTVSSDRNYIQGVSSNVHTHQDDLTVSKTRVRSPHKGHFQTTRFFGEIDGMACLGTKCAGNIPYPNNG